MLNSLWANQKLFANLFLINLPFFINETCLQKRDLKPNRPKRQLQFLSFFRVHGAFWVVVFGSRHCISI